MVRVRCSEPGLVNFTSFGFFLAAFLANFRWWPLSALFIFTQIPRRSSECGYLKRAPPQKKCASSTTIRGRNEHDDPGSLTVCFAPDSVASVLHGISGNGWKCPGIRGFRRECLATRKSPRMGAKSLKRLAAGARYPLFRTSVSCFIPTVLPDTLGRPL